MVDKVYGWMLISELVEVQGVHDHACGNMMCIIIMKCYTWFLCVVINAFRDEYFAFAMYPVFWFDQTNPKS